jgi:drug/metabolite transporter (DMT)-like permease
LLSTAGNLLLVNACRAAPLSTLAPWRYSFLLWSTALGGLLWSESPSLSALAGMALIAVAGVGAARRRD